MVSSTKTQSSKEDKSQNENKKEEDIKPEPEYKFKSAKVDEKLKKMIVDAHTKFKGASSLPSMVEGIKKELDAKSPKGWVVFAGKHMAGACSYIQGTMVDFEYDGTAFVIFQTFCPE